MLRVQRIKSTNRGDGCTTLPPCSQRDEGVEITSASLPMPRQSSATGCTSERSGDTLAAD
jgi:hypothetical protein